MLETKYIYTKKSLFLYRYINIKNDKSHQKWSTLIFRILSCIWSRCKSKSDTKYLPNVYDIPRSVGKCIAFNCTLLIDETHIIFGTCICDPVVSMLLLNFKCIDDDHIKILACDLDNYSWSYSRFIVSPFRIVEKDGKE